MLKTIIVVASLLLAGAEAIEAPFDELLFDTRPKAAYMSWRSRNWANPERRALRYAPMLQHR